jgi:hypothetical protein
MLRDFVLKTCFTATSLISWYARNFPFGFVHAMPLSHKYYLISDLLQAHRFYVPSSSKTERPVANFPPRALKNFNKHDPLNALLILCPLRVEQTHSARFQKRGQNVKLIWLVAKELWGIAYIAHLFMYTRCQRRVISLFIYAEREMGRFPIKFACWWEYCNFRA